MHPTQWCEIFFLEVRIPETSGNMEDVAAGDA
jgi:hypothetical protein